MEEIKENEQNDARKSCFSLVGFEFLFNQTKFIIIMIKTFFLVYAYLKNKNEIQIRI